MAASASLFRVSGILFGLLVGLLCLAVQAEAYRPVPRNVRNFYKTVRARDGCKNKLASGFYSNDEDNDSFSYCGDYLKHGIIYLKGNGSNLANMDVDCDGVQGGPADDGRCKLSDDTQAQTAFKDVVQEYGEELDGYVKLTDLDSNVHSYVVFGNSADSGEKPGWPTFNPAKHGVEPLSVMVVVCDSKMFYGIYGDENGDDGEHAMIGETSISLATACFGKDEEINGDSGHDANDVLYIAFTGAKAVPGAKGADWLAPDFDGFEKSLHPLGDELIKQIPGGK